MPERDKMSQDIIHRILTLGQEMRDDIRPADDEAGLGSRWDELMREISEDPVEKAKKEAATVIRKLVRGGIVAMREGNAWLEKNAP